VFSTVFNQKKRFPIGPNLYVLNEYFGLTGDMLDDSSREVPSSGVFEKLPDGIHQISN
jgi:hypothetical protein